MFLFSPANRKSLYAPDFLEKLGPGGYAGDLFRKLVEKVKTDEPLNRLLYLDSKTYVPGDILTKVDRMSMAVSLEARAPLLDHKLIDFVTGVRASLKLAGLETKHLLKEAVRDLIPTEILHRPKQGFGVPIEEWINQQLRTRIRDTLSDARTRQRGYTNSDYLDVLLDEHERGRRDHSMGPWSLLMFELWHRRFVDGGSSNRGFKAEHEAVLAIEGS